MVQLSRACDAVAHQSCHDHCRLTVAQVYSKSTEPFDPSKKGGRYKSEFIWNTNWQVRVTRAWQWMCRHMDNVVRDKRLTHYTHTTIAGNTEA